MAENKKVLVIGGGISGLTAAVEAAEAGLEAYIVEKNPYLGGRVAQINKYFWKLCPPNCGLEIQFKRINNPRISSTHLQKCKTSRARKEILMSQ
jgi:quinone-modifying oxidoreductase subunit QmoA